MKTKKETERKACVEAKLIIIIIVHALTNVM